MISNLQNSYPLIQYTILQNSINDIFPIIINIYLDLINQDIHYIIYNEILRHFAKDVRIDWVAEQFKTINRINVYMMLEMDGRHCYHCDNLATIQIVIYGYRDIRTHVNYCDLDFKSIYNDDYQIIDKFMQKYNQKII